MNRLEGKRTLITGGTSGIGLETARQFIAEGARVAVTGTNPKTLEEARAVLGNDALILRVDAADVEAQAGLARTLSGELIGRGIRVNAVSPGPVQTPLYGKLGMSPADLDKTARAILSQVPAGRFGTPAEIAKVVVFLASDESPFAVGSELIVDGGMGL